MDCREYKYRAAQEMGGSDQRFIKRLFMTPQEKIRLLWEDPTKDL